MEEKHYKGSDFECIVLKDCRNLSDRDKFYCIIFKDGKIEVEEKSKVINEMIETCEEVEHISLDYLDAYKIMKMKQLKKKFEELSAIRIKEYASNITLRMFYGIINHMYNDIEKVAAEHVLDNRDLCFKGIEEIIDYDSDANVNYRRFSIGIARICIYNEKRVKIKYFDRISFRKDEILELLKEKLKSIFGEFNFNEEFEIYKDIDTIRNGLFKLL